MEGRFVVLECRGAGFVAHLERDGWSPEGFEASLVIYATGSYCAWTRIWWLWMHVSPALLDGDVQDARNEGRFPDHRPQLGWKG
jgi:hypothetical protein